MYQIFNSTSIKIFFLRIFQISGIIGSIMGGIFYALKDRFDVVACFILLLNNLIITYSILLSDIQKKKPIATYPRYSPIDGEHLVEAFDDGFKEALNIYLLNKWCDISSNGKVIDDFIIKAFQKELDFINEFQKIKLLGRFNFIQIGDLVKVNFIRNGLVVNGE